MTALTQIGPAQAPQLSRGRRARTRRPSAGAGRGGARPEQAPVEIAPNDPLLAYFQARQRRRRHRARSSSTRRRCASSRRRA